MACDLLYFKLSGLDATNKSQNLQLFSERTSSIKRNVKLKDRARFF
jgi:hypothetical protein